MGENNRVILCTGLPGIEKGRFIADTRKLAKLNGKDIKIYAVGDMLLSLAREDDPLFIPDNVLNMPSSRLEGLVRSVYADIERDIGNHEYSLITTHATFFWRKVITDSGNARFLEKVRPDMYITIVQAPELIVSGLQKSTQWKSQMPSEDEVCLWQNIEAMATEKYWAGMQKTSEGKRPRFLVLPRDSEPEDMLKLFMYPDVEFVYSAFPMTQLKDEEGSYAKIREFQRRLREYFGVICPRKLNISLAASGMVSNQTVHMDLDHFVKDTTKTIYYVPEMVPSTGGITEVTTGSMEARDIYQVITAEEAKKLLLPDGSRRISPFVSYNSRGVFWDEDSFFRYLEEAGYKKLEMKRK
ncbi:MAG TPA: hypothetical protein HA362_00125 [Nanoarchaeota archaeon]|nr:hypothetical protein [Nanoarchaeota archaeon]